MSGLIGNLISILEKQAEGYGNLLALAEEKREVIVANDVKTLQKITGIENVIIAKNQKLERERVVVFQDIALVLNKKVSDLSLSTLAELIREQPDYPALHAVTQKIRKDVEQLKAKNEQNRILVDHSIEYIDFTMNVIRGAMTNKQTFYSADGNEIADETVFFDAKQ